MKHCDYCGLARDNHYSPFCSEDCEDEAIADGVAEWSEARVQMDGWLEAMIELRDEREDD